MATSIISLSPRLLSGLEGNSGTTQISLTANLSAPSSSEVTAAYTTSDVTAIAGSDYVATTGTLIFAPGEVTKTINIPIMGDTQFEGTESFFVALTSVTGAQADLNGGAGLFVTIDNDDKSTTPVISLARNLFSFVEGNNGTSLMPFTVNLSSAATTVVTATYTTSDITAKAGADYVATTGILTFMPGEVTKTFSIPIIGDTQFEGFENFFVSLTGANGAQLDLNGGTGVFANIDDDDKSATPVIALSRNVISFVEGNSGLSQMPFTVRLSTPATTVVTAIYATTDITATAGSDYIATSGTLTFLPGEVTKTFSVPIIGDTRFEGFENFFVSLTNATGALLDPNGGTGVFANIENDDTLEDPVDRLSIIGTDGNDRLVGTRDNDNIKALAGNDSVSGLAGNDTINGGAGSDVVLYADTLANYTLTRTGSNYTVRHKPGIDGIDTVTDVETLKFSDLSVNLNIQAIANATAQPVVARLMELYVALFARVPDAEGMIFWLGEYTKGSSINAIADEFYKIGIQYSNLTKFNSTMTNADFVNVVYKNVLGRADGADATGLAYWTNKLASGEASRGSLVSTILDSAHTFKGDALYGYVADLLDNKIAVSRTIAVDWGIGFATPDAAITQGMAIAASVTPNGTAQALTLLGISSGDMSLF